MPIYEYRCQSCGHELEKLQKLSDAPLVDCPACGEPSLSKLISAAGFRLKGGGWYETDFKKDGKRNLAGDSSDAKKTDSGDGGKSDTKSDSKPDSGKSEKKTETKAAKPSADKAA
ncbi:MAG: zinc ribbon domain-containing protein [Wenzhouxiangella sp.]|jgi:putative FmdB family regulatory protein|nr:zinc ribbon domain-containing protein [Wenzhouxiangella sp.]